MENKKEELGRFEKCRIAIEKGITCDAERGVVFGVRGNEIKSKNKAGYIDIPFRYNKKYYILKAHQFIYYCVNGEYDINLHIDHFNMVRDDNRIENLRLTTHSENLQNTKAKGIYWDKSRNKWMAQIYINGKTINLGRYDLEEDAIKARKAGKLKYHKY